MLPKHAIIHAAFFTPTSRGWGAPILLWAAPGTAKTSAARQFAASVRAPCEVLSPGERGEGAFGVVPVPSGERDDMSLVYPAPQWVRTMGAFGLVLADELTTAPPALQPAILGLALDGRIGGAALSQRVRVFAAANPVECSAAGYELPAPAANRFVHVQWSVDVAEVCAFLVGGSTGDLAHVDAIAEEKRVMTIWPEAHAKAAGLIAAFLTRHPDLLHKMPADGDPQRGKAWPSPRSWEMATRLLATGVVHALSEADTDTLCAGSVGETAWHEFRAYQASMDLPDPAEVLDGKIQWAPDAKRLDITAAVLSGCTALVAPKTAANRETRAAVLWALLDTVGNAGARDITIQPATVLVRSGLAADKMARKVLADQHMSGLATALSAK